MSSSSSSSSNPTLSRGIRLRHYPQTRSTDGNGFRFRVVAYGAYDMPNTIFLYKRKVLNASDSTTRDAFQSVCSTVDLSVFPEYEPEGVPPFFRASEIDLILPSNTLADDTWAAIKQDVANLVRALGFMDDLEPGEIVVYGDPPAVDPPA